MRTLAVLLAAAAMAAPAIAAPAASTDTACPVWQRELSFARSVAEHDAAAFAEHIDAEAVFQAGSPQPLRGREAIGRGWAGIVAGKDVRLRWYPAHTVAVASGELAWSTGPVLIETRAADGTPRHASTQYRSLWRKGADGTWRVLFDDGNPATPASAEQVQAFERNAAAPCPAGAA